jgi:PAS domain S-box-containing protein
MELSGSGSSLHSWIRFQYGSDGLISNLEGSCESLLGISAGELLERNAPAELLPPFLSGQLDNDLPEEPKWIGDGFSLEGILIPRGNHIDVVLFRTGTAGIAGGASVLADLDAGVAGIDPKGIVRIWNSGMEKIFSIPGQFALGKKLEDVLSSPLLYSWKTVMETVYKGRQSVVQCVPEVNRRVTATFHRGGPGVIGTFFDTTESYITEKRLRTNRRMNQAYFQTIRTGLVLFSEDYRILASNRFFGVLFGVTENLVGMPIYEILPRKSFSGIEKISSELFGGKKEVFPPVLIRYRSPDGSNRVIRQIFRSLKPTHGEIPYVVGIFEELTRTVEAEENLEQTRDQIAAVSELVKCLENNPVPVSGDRIAAILHRCLCARATAVYVYDPYSTITLIGSHGGWGDGMPTDDFSELRLPSSVWTTLPGSLLVEHEMGKLQDTFDNCFVIPIGSGSETIGFIIAGNVPAARVEDLYVLGGVVSFSLRLSLDSSRERSEREQFQFLRNRDQRFLESLLSSIDTPVAVFTEDWRVLHWNGAMEVVTGFSLPTAINHPELVTEKLFAAVGGTSGARTLARSDSLGKTWETEDGNRLPVTWRIKRTESVGQGSFTSAYMLIGNDASDRTGQCRTRMEIARLEVLGEGLASLLSAVSFDQIADIASRVFLNASAAHQVEVTLTGRASSSTCRESDDVDPGNGNDWSIELSNDTHSVGTCSFSGGHQVAALSSFAEGVCLTVLGMEERAIGSSLVELASGSRGRFLFSNAEGAILFSTWPRSVLNRVSRGESGADVFGLFAEEERPGLNDMMRQATITGRAVSSLLDGDGSRWNVAVSALSGDGKNILLLWWPEDNGQGWITRSEHQTAGIRKALLGFLIGSSATGVSTLRGIRSDLAHDNARRSSLQSTIYEFGATGKLLGYLDQLDSSRFASSPGFDVDEMLRMLVNDLIEDKHRPPDMEVIDSIPQVRGDPVLVRSSLRRLCTMTDPGGIARLETRLVRSSRMAPEEVPSLHPWTPESLVFINVSGSVRLQEPPDSGDLINMIRDGFIGPSVELGLIRHLLRTMGGECRSGERPGSIDVILPVACDHVSI